MQSTLEHTILLDLLVKSEVEVFLQVLQADGGERAACINAAMLAVANAGGLSPITTISTVLSGPLCIDFACLQSKGAMPNLQASR